MSAPGIHLALIVLKATAILAAGALLAATGRRAPARVLHALWTALLATLLVLPVLHLAVPARTPAWLRTPAVPAWTMPAASHPHRSTLLAPPIDLAGPAAQAPPARPPRPTPDRQVPWGALLLAVWACGCAIGFMRMAAGVWRRRTIAADAVNDDVCRERLARVAARLGMRTPRLRMPPHAVPATWGVLRPVIVLPVSARGWPGDRLDAVLHHELVHVRRRDALWCGVGECACALFWFHPGVWMARRAALRAQEQAADDLVLRTGAERFSYARALLETARLYAHPSTDAAPALFRGRSELSSRLRRLTHAAPAADSAGWPLAALPLLLVAAVGCIVPLRPAPASAADAGEVIESRTTARPAVAAGAHPPPAVGAPVAGAADDAETSPLAEADPSATTSAPPPNVSPIAARTGADTLDYDRQMAAAGLRELSVPALRRLRNLGVTPTYVREMRDAGLRLHLPAEAVSLWIQGVTPAFVRDVRRAGTPIDAPADAVELWIHAVPAAFIRELADAGVDVSRASPLRILHNHGVRPAYVRELASAGMPLRDPAQILEMHIHKVPGRFVAALRETGLRGVTVREVRRLHNFGVDPRDPAQIRTVSGYDLALARIPSLLSD
ncbi:M56 family metallopeptidase [Longimicrobium sp.]|uniref:M56 family metallopeptidase n=1 Tax=Longimicrobium sp. TaxID=2029185 RepID=UPI003B3A2EEF